MSLSTPPHLSDDDGLLVAQEVLNVPQHHHHALHAHLLVVDRALEAVNLTEDGRELSL